MKRQSLVQINMFFKKTKFTLLKSIYFHIKTPTKICCILSDRAREKFNFRLEKQF